MRWRVVAWLAVFALFPFSLAAEEKLVCADGLKRCAPLEGKPQKYKRCLDLACAPSPRTEDGKPKPCDLGLWKCTPLRKTQDAYWACMGDICAGNPDAKVNQSDLECPDGRAQCSPKLESYHLCVNLICKTPVNTYEGCDRGRADCAGALQNYWDCMAAVCFGGELKKYTDTLGVVFPQTAADEGSPIGPDGKPYPEDSPYVLRGAPPDLRFPPKGVDPKAWSSVTPPERRLEGPVSEQFECYTKGEMYCSSRDIMSCVCEDGSRPRSVDRNQPRAPDFQGNRGGMFGFKAP